MSACIHLPNAVHIDAVIASVRQCPDAWSATYDAAQWAARDATRDATWNAAWDAARSAVWDAARSAAMNEAFAETQGAALSTTLVIWGSIVALIAYDDCSRYLDMPADELTVWARLTEDSAAVLLVPYLRVCEHIKAQETESLSVTI